MAEPDGMTVSATTLETVPLHCAKHPFHAANHGCKGPLPALCGSVSSSDLGGPESVGVQTAEVKVMCPGEPGVSDGSDVQTMDVRTMCLQCGTSNRAIARFCGQCGNSLAGAAVMEGLAPVTMENPGNGWVPAWLRNRRTLWRWGRKKLNGVVWVMVWAVFILFGLSPILAIQHFSPAPPAIPALQEVTWGELRTICSRSSGFSLEEIDALAGEVWGSLPRANEPVSLASFRKLELALQDSPDPLNTLPGGLSGSRHLLKGHLGGLGPVAPALSFGDLPLDHDVYRAWKALLQRGIVISETSSANAGSSEAHPFDIMMGSDWRFIKKQLETLFKSASSGEANSRRPAGSRFLSRDQVATDLVELAGWLGFPEARARAAAALLAGNPTRFQVLSAVSALLGQGKLENVE